MIKQKIKFNDPFTGEPRETVEHFHLNKHDLMTLKAEAEDAGFEDPQDWFNSILSRGKSTEIFETFKKFILMAYGRRQGSNFVKSQAVSADFESSEAFSEFVYSLFADSESAGVFFTTLMQVPVERAPMLSGQHTPEKFPNQAEANVFEQPVPQTGPPVGTPPEAPAAPSAQQGYEEFVQKMPEPVTAESVTNNDNASANAPRRLTQAELNTMSFSEVQKGIQQNRWRMPQGME